MNHKILYLSYDGMTDSLGQSQVLPYLFGLADKGFCVHLISFEKNEFSDDVQRIKKLCAKNGVLWYPQQYTKTPPLVSTLKDIRQMKKVALNLHKAVDFDLVHCRGHIPGIIGRYLQRTKNIKFIFDMRGFWADERVEGGIWNINNPIFKIAYNYFKKKELEFFNECDTIVSLTQNGKQEIESWKNIPNQTPIEVIPCCVDLDHFCFGKVDKVALDEKRKQLRISKDEFILGYVGSIGTWYMLPEMLDYYAVLRRKKTQSKFLFISKEPKENIINLAKEKGIPESEIIVTGTTHNEVPLHISLFDFSIFFIRPTFSKKASSPTKQGELMALGIPIICNAGIGDTDLIIKNTNAGIVLESLDSENYQACNLDPSQYDKDEIRAGAEKWYSLKFGVKSFHEIYSKLLD